MVDNLTSQTACTVNYVCGLISGVEIYLQRWAEE